VIGDQPDGIGTAKVTQRLTDRVALVFGAGSCGPGWGNGKASAVLYAREGAHVVAVDLLLERAQETADIIAGEGCECLALAADVSKAEDVRVVVEKAMRRYGRINILHNNVGISLFGGAVELSEEDWDRTLDCNLKSVFLSCKYVLPIMLAHGRGVITNISSILSERVSQYDEIAYYASKAGVDHLTRAIAVRYAAQGIRANAIQPGLIDTPLLYANPAIVDDSHGGREKMVRERNARSPTGTMGTGWDVAHAAVFLASDEAGYINGVVLPVDGGLLCKQG
jgi:NAD(P)-dependent dehydrogenase (short-subunit alcohol dehydrogenase family)